MLKMTPLPGLWVTLATACVFTVACNRDLSAGAEDVLATVNGIPITEADVLFASRTTGGHQTNAPSVDKQAVLEGIIQQELSRQRALELGLDADPAYRQELAQLEAQMNAFKRKKLSEMFLRREITQKARVDEAEARQYFERNAARLRTEIHVWQILRRDEGAIEQIRDELARGTAFEEVAGKQFPDLPDKARRPWDLGYLRWSQVPEAWQNVVHGLKPGETSNVIRGPNSRFWIIKLIDRRENPDLTFEQIKPTITGILSDEKARQLREETLRDLRGNARIVYSK
jgi:parvulin-like peptidyl-prolyl isomerase